MNLKDYLKKYTTISTKFIDDFHSFYENNNSEYRINLNIVTKWLKARKDSLKDTLINSYAKNIDYIIIKINTIGKVGGAGKEEIFLTADCFKRLCMLSKTQKAEEVRTYFIELEKHIDKYKDYIIYSMEKRIGQLEKNQKPKLNPKGGIIYVIRSSKDIDGIYKIGKTQNFKKRIVNHNSSHIDELDIIFIYETKNIDEVEACLKGILKSKQYRKRKEFYEIDIDILKQLINGCELLTLKAKMKPNKIQNGGYYIYLSINSDSKSVN